MNKPNLSIIILCYHAGDKVCNFVSRTIGSLEIAKIFNYELILVGNYLEESDITPKVVKDLAAKNPKIRYTARKKQGMMGWDMKSGFELAQGNYLAVIDGDGQMPVEDLLKLYQKICHEKLDLAKTYRIKREDTFWRKFISFFYNILFHLLFPGLNSKDINSKPKIFTRQAYQRMKLSSNDWFIDAEIMIQARRYKFNIGEIPTVFLGLTDRCSFVRPRAVFEFFYNLIIYRIKEFKYI